MLFFLILALFVVSGVLSAQTASTGTVRRRRHRSYWRLGCWCCVNMVDASTGISRTATSNEAGRYFFANVVPANTRLR